MMTATSRGRRGAPSKKARYARGLGMPNRCGPTASDREGRPAAAAARGVRVVEREARFLEVALVVEGHAVQVLRAEAVHEAAHAGTLDHDVLVGRLLLDAQA